MCNMYRHYGLAAILVRVAQNHAASQNLTALPIIKTALCTWRVVLLLLHVVFVTTRPYSLTFALPLHGVYVCVCA